MLYVEFATEKKTYKLRLTTRNVVALEKKLGCNPLSIFGDGETVPTVSSMVAILHASLQEYEHGISYDDTFAIFDEWLEEGHNAVEFINIILEVYRASGLVPKEADSGGEKN